MMYPLYLTNIEQEGMHEVLTRSYLAAHEGDGSDGGAIEQLVAMVQAHAGPIGTALGDGDRALEGLHGIARELASSGLWACNNNPCIESTLCIANIIQDMLIQSWSDPAGDEAGPIRIFPAMPSSWPDAEFHDLRAEGAFLVSAKRIGGQTQWVRIKSLAGEPCRVRVDLKAPQIQGERDFTVTTLAENLIAIDLHVGESVILKRADC